MYPSGPSLLNAVGDAVMGCRHADPGPDLDGAKDVLAEAIEAYAPVLEERRDYAGRAAVHGIADRWLGGIAVAKLLRWADEPDG